MSPEACEIEQLLEDGFVTFETDEFGEQRVVLTELGQIALRVQAAEPR